MVAAGFVALKESGSDFPPTLPKFLVLCREAGSNWKEAYNRLINREKPLNRIEELTRQECAFEIRNHLEASKAEKRFKDVFLKWLERDRRGEIPDKETKMIAQHSTVSCTDKAREEYSRTSKNKRAQEWVERLKKAKESN